ncbi:MAG: hypothetical protein P9X24_15175 [Candidatus Hatepunaea meridiana]|nr:hypothetical protein [Candidatus Hatepunaea meridiana]
MPNYTFENLSPIDFEMLSRDLMQKKLGILLESFGPGRDTGIDFRYSSDTMKTLIVQCKHNPRIRFSDFRRKLEKNEFPKVQQIDPKRYIIVTSASLTPSNKDELMRIFTPYIKLTSDILTPQDINNLLGVYPEVEKLHFKLWLTSTAVLEELLNRRSIRLSELELRRISRDSEVYVKNDSFEKALQLLEENHSCIIMGIPGIGKTILAEMLVLYYVQKGYSLIKIEEDISEAYDHDYKDIPRIFYYDDFLGTVSPTDKLGKNEDKRLISFIDMVKESSSSRFILTTREYIYKQAIRSYEHLSRAESSLIKYILDMSSYTRRVKAQILYNHLYFSEIDLDLKLEVLKNGGYLNLIDHRNYSPRIIDIMTQKNQVKDISHETYMLQFKKNLDNPQLIWEKAFSSQLRVSSRNILLTMFPLSSRIRLSALEEAFEEFHSIYSTMFSVSRDPKDFTTGLRELDGTFIRTYRDDPELSITTMVMYHNPSVRDFLEKIVINEKYFVQIGVRMARFVSQLDWLWNYQSSGNSEHVFRNHMISSEKELLDAMVRCFKGNGKPSSRSKSMIGLSEDIGTYYYPRENIVTKIGFIMNVQSLVTSQSLHRFIGRQLHDLSTQLDERKLQLPDCVSLIIIFIDWESNTLYPVDMIIDKLQNLILDYDRDDLDDVMEVANLIKYADKYLTKTDISELRDSFCEIMDNYSGAKDNVVEDPCFSDPNEYYDFADEIDSVGKILDIETEEYTDLLREIASGLEPDYDDYSGGYGGYNSSSGQISDNEVHSLFKTLPT